MVGIFITVLATPALESILVNIHPLGAAPATSAAPK
jgi:hypothetical protein